MNTKTAIKNVADVPNKFNIAGGNITGNITLPNDTSLMWSRNTDYAKILFKNTADSDSDSYMHFLTGDNGNEYFKFSSISGGTTTDWLTIKSDHLRFKGNAVYHTANKPTPADIGALDKNNDSTLASGKKILLGYSSSWLNGDSSNGAVTLRAGGNLFLHGDADTSSTSEYVSIKAGNNDLRVISSAASTGQDKLTFNGNIVYHAGRKPTVSEIGAAASNHSHNLVNLGSEAFGSGNDLNTYNTNRTWVCRTGNSSVNRPADYYTVLNVGAEHNSNFQLAHHYGSASEFFVRGRHDTTGGYTPWAKVYTDKNKPTPADIGAAAASHSHNYLPLSGGTLTGIVTAPVLNITDNNGYRHNSLGAGDNHVIGVASGIVYLGNPQAKTQIEGNSNPTVLVGSNKYTMYHTGNKPTPADIGAIPSSKITVSQTAPSNPSTGDLWIAW